MEKGYFISKRKNMKENLFQENLKVKVFFTMAMVTYIKVALKIIKSMVKASYF